MNILNDTNPQSDFCLSGQRSLGSLLLSLLACFVGGHFIFSNIIELTVQTVYDWTEQDDDISVLFTAELNYN